jgi:PAS domain-containing protein
MEERRLRVFENRVLRRIFGPKRDEVTVLYGCETWSLTLKEERRLRVFENRVLRRIFGPKMDEVTVLYRCETWSLI